MNLVCWEFSNGIKGEMEIRCELNAMYLYNILKLRPITVRLALYRIQKDGSLSAINIR
jgi:hypothetical protein